MLIALARADVAQAIHGFALFGQKGLQRIGVFRCRYHHHADAAIEGAVHFLRFYIAGLLQSLEKLGQRP